MATQQVVDNSISLKGSAQMVSEFFYYGINSILYQRGVYPTDSFKKTQKYGLPLLLTTDEKLESFLQTILSQIQRWLETKECQRLIVVISDVANKTVLERWQFNVTTDEEIQDGGGKEATREKPEKKIRQEICDVIRQITASVTFLPLLETACLFDVLIYTKKDSHAPDGWGDSGPCLIINGEEVKLRSFSTGIHSVETRVAYKADVV